MRSIVWNPRLRLVFSDVDETIADLYRPAQIDMTAALTRLLREGIRLVLITGQSIRNVEQRVIMDLPATLRRQMAVGACSGAELWGYTPSGKRKSAPFYTIDSALTDVQSVAWRSIVWQLVNEFRLAYVAPMPIAEFQSRYGREPWKVLLDDRGPQITIEFPNAYQLSEAGRGQLERRLGAPIHETDMRIPVLRRADQLLKSSSLPITPRLAGVFALDFAISGASKTRAVEAALSPYVLGKLGLGEHALEPCEIEVWGDRFSQPAGTDWLMCAALDHAVRAVSFRNEDPSEFPSDYNIHLWDGAYRLHDGLLEYLQSR